MRFNFCVRQRTFNISSKIFFPSNFIPILPMYKDIIVKFSVQHDEV